VIRVLLADDDTLVRQGIRHLLSLAPDIEVVGEASDGDETLARIGDRRPDVVLLDARMPGRSGLEVLAALADPACPAAPAPPCLLLTTFDDSTLFLEAVRLGARGYLRKDVALEELLAAIRALADGRTFLQPAVTQRLLERTGPTRAASRPSWAAEDAANPQPLTAREREVLRLMAGGFSNREIGEALGTAEGTVKIQVSSILGKLGARDRTQAVIKALASGLATVG
jgi:DNA-binding NarL/FixJ family response regulator